MITIYSKDMLINLSSNSEHANNAEIILKKFQRKVISQ